MVADCCPCMGREHSVVRALAIVKEYLMKRPMYAALAAVISVGLVTLSNVSYAEDDVAVAEEGTYSDDEGYPEEPPPPTDYELRLGKGVFAHHLPKHPIDHLDTYVEGGRQYKDREAAFEEYQRLYPDDAGVVKELCGITTPFSLSTVHEYHYCLQRKWVREEVEATEQLSRFLQHSAYLDPYLNDELEQGIQRFERYPSEYNFHSITSAAASDHNDWVFGDADDLSLFDRMDFPGKVMDRHDPMRALRSFRPTPRGGGSGLDAAVAYARKHATKYNRAYKSFTDNGEGDCANFVSQILVAGGKKFTGSWRPYTDQWVNADALRGAMAKTVKFRNFQSLVNAAVIGNVIFYDDDGDDVYIHAGFIVDKNRSNLEIAQHTNNYVAWTNGQARRWKRAQQWRLGTWVR